MIKSRKMIKWRIHVIISIENFSYFTKSRTLFSEAAKLNSKRATNFHFPRFV